MDMKEGHIRPLPTANSITAPPTATILFDTNKTKFVPKNQTTNFSSENFFNALRKYDLGPKPLFHLILHKIFPTVLLTTLNH
jgi:hypothetical protein